MDFRNVLANAKEQLASYAEYSVKNITHICSEYGPRECGSENEKNAQEYMGEQLKNYADSVTRETFDAHPKAFMSFVPTASFRKEGREAACKARIRRLRLQAQRRAAVPKRQPLCSF